EWQVEQEALPPQLARIGYLLRTRHSMSDSSSSHSIPGVATPSRSMTVISMLLMPPVHTLLQVLASSVRPAEAATAHGSRRAGPLRSEDEPPATIYAGRGSFREGSPQMS